jgi:hypothetical protein
MGEIYNHGVTSTSMPGINGANGQRANITYFSTAYDLQSAVSMFNASINGNTVTIYNYQNIQPIVNDYIVYSTYDIIYLTKITSFQNNFCLTEILDTWINSKTSSVSSTTSSDDIDISINLTNKLYNISTLDENADLTIDSKTFTALPIITTNTKSVKSFVVVSKNDNKLGTYRIELEFVTDLVSPNMDSIIAPKFYRDNTNINRLEISSSYYRDLNQCNQMTLRGFLNQYDRKEDNGILTSYHRQQKPVDFDIEYLENFSIILKDFNDGIGSKSYITDIIVPSEMIYRVTNNKKTNMGSPRTYEYRCFIYIYVMNSDGTTYNKQRIGEIQMSEFLN